MRTRLYGCCFLREQSVTMMAGILLLSWHAKVKIYINPLPKVVFLLTT